MIDLAPNNPYSLTLHTPIILAPGCAGAGVPRDLDPELIGAITTRTAVYSSSSSGRVHWGTTPAGVVFERLPTVAFRTLIKDEARRWARSPVPVILSVRGSGDDLAEMAIRLEPIEGVAGVLLQADDDLVAAVGEVRAITPLPLLALLPSVDQIGDVARSVVAAGADALVTCAYPRGYALRAASTISGVLVGPTLAPLTLRSIVEVASVVDVPLIAHGGVADHRIAQQCLANGATAAMIDGALYGDTLAPQRIAAMLLRTAAHDAANT